MRQRYQQLPTHFVPKHSNKYLMRKSLINTKFQWLMRYINNDPPSSTSLATKMPLQPSKPTQSRTLVTSYGRSLATRNQEKANKSVYHQEAIFQRRNQKSRIKTEPIESFNLGDKNVPKNKSLLMNRAMNKRGTLFFEGQWRPGKQIGRSKMNFNHDKENLDLTPWEDNTDSRMGAYF